MAKANDLQHGGNHYKQFKGLEPWDVITYWGLGYLDGTALKYIARWKHKNGVEDLNKAIHFLQKAVEVETARLAASSVERPSNVAAVHYSENAGVPMGGLYNSDNVAGQDWHGLAAHPEFLQDNSAINAYHMKD